MSLFDFPRINFSGTVSFSPATANNDDFAPNTIFSNNWGVFSGEPLALMDSKNVKARSFGMSDEAFINWAQKIQTFEKLDNNGKPFDPPQTTQQIPSEWNYYGALSSSINASVTAVQTAAGEQNIYTQNEESSEPLSALVGAALSFNNSGHFTDVNSQGSPPSTQFFVDNLTLKDSSTTWLSGAASKGASIWLNFFRNVNLTADGGAAAYVYHVIKKSDSGTVINLPGFEDPNIVGVIFRYYLYRALVGGIPNQTNEEVVDIYKNQETNPASLQIVGTFAPLYKGEDITTMPTGRLLVSDVANVPTPTGSHNNSMNSQGLIALGPAVLQQNDNLISADFIGTFPDNYDSSTQENPKYDFGAVELQVSNGIETAVIDTIDYTDENGGNEKGWLFDFDISSNEVAQRILNTPNASFQLVNSCNNVLEETDYYFVSNQLGIYAEQFGSGHQFRNQGTIEPATISVYHRGQKLNRHNCPPITLWQYKSIPLEAPGNAVAIDTNFEPGKRIEVDTSQPGNFLFTFTINDERNPAPAGYPPASYLAFQFPPYITNWSSISLRILPNDVDFSKYYVNPDAAEPVGNELLTFAVVYKEVLQTYHLLYPAMNQIFNLKMEKVVAAHASRILQVTDPTMWLEIGFMPRTRDLSASRRTLLQAWCRKVMAVDKKRFFF